MTQPSDRCTCADATELCSWCVTNRTVDSRDAVDGGGPIDRQFSRIDGVLAAVKAAVRERLGMRVTSDVSPEDEAAVARWRERKNQIDAQRSGDAPLIGWEAACRAAWTAEDKLREELTALRCEAAKTSGSATTGLRPGDVPRHSTPARAPDEAGTYLRTADAPPITNENVIAAALRLVFDEVGDACAKVEAEDLCDEQPVARGARACLRAIAAIRERTLTEPRRESDRPIMPAVKAPADEGHKAGPNASPACTRCGKPMLQSGVCGDCLDAEVTRSSSVDLPTFEQAWAQKEAEGYQYGADALEHVRFGWELRQDAELVAAGVDIPAFLDKVRKRVAEGADDLAPEEASCRRCGVPERHLDGVGVCVDLHACDRRGAGPTSAAAQHLLNVLTDSEDGWTDGVLAAADALRLALPPERNRASIGAVDSLAAELRHRPKDWRALYQSVLASLARISELLGNTNGDPEVTAGIVERLIREERALREAAECAQRVYRAWDEGRSYVNKMLAMGSALKAAGQFTRSDQEKP